MSSHRDAIFQPLYINLINLLYCSGIPVNSQDDIIKKMDIGYIITVLGVILVSMTLHEAMHAFMGYFLGDDTAKAQGRLTLNPLKHIDPIMTVALPVMLAIMGMPIFGGAKPVPFNPHQLRYGEWGAAIVALAGPLTNFVLAFIFFGVYAISGGQGWIAHISMITVMVNLGFFVFNMLPIPPLDGSRVLYALAPDGVRRVMEQIEQFGVFFVFGILLVAQSAIGQIMTVAIQAIIQLFIMIFRI